MVLLKDPAGAHSVWRGDRPNTCSLRRYDPDQVRRVHRIGISGKGHPAGGDILAQDKNYPLKPWSSRQAPMRLSGSLSQSCHGSFARVVSPSMEGYFASVPRMMWGYEGLDATTTVNSIDHSAWKARFEEASTQIQDWVRDLWHRLARDPARLQRVQTALIVLLVVWSLSSVSQLIWIPFRANPIEVAPGLALNPPKPSGQKQAEVIDTSSVLGLGLFGGSSEALTDADGATVNETSRDSIEQNAQETRLALTLTGIVASTEDGRGSAVIKSGAAEQVYAVGDALPASGQVVLAKVMPQQVVIDNNGTYELIKLYEGPGIAIPARAARQPRQGAIAPVADSSPTEGGPPATAAEQTALASQYRRQLYDSPESLASVVSVSPVQEGDRVVGYRIAPGADRVAFDTFGFQPGDIVTAVNGLALSDASNTVKLYQTMKDATQATFDIERDGGTVTVNVDLASP